MLETTMLVISDDPSLVESLRGVVRSIDGLKIAALAEIEEAHAYVSWDHVSLVLIHLKRSGADSGVVRLLRVIAGARRPVATLVVVDEQDADQAHSLLRLGVAEYLGRPLDLTRLSYLVHALTVRAREATPTPPDLDARRRNLMMAVTHPSMAVTHPDDQAELDDPFMSQVRRVAPCDATILLGGETGTGKTRLARRIHEWSARRSEPFVVINCASMNANRLESELFGHTREWTDVSRKDRRGKFEEVGRGTLFLDEVDALPLSIQSRLLRVVEDREVEPAVGGRPVPVRARLIAASSRDLDREVETGRFRSDLYYRLNVIGFHLEPLRDRRGEIPSLASKFLAESSANHGGVVDSISAAALQVLEEYDWPGNIRELRNTIERAVSLAEGREIQPTDLPDAITRRDFTLMKRRLLHASPTPISPGTISTLADIKRDAELARITEALEKHSNNRLRAASELGISRMTLYKKLYKYGLMIPSRNGQEVAI